MNVQHSSIKKIILTAFLSLAAVVICLAFSGIKADAKTVTIKTPEQLRDLNWKNKGFGPGTYKIGNDMTLGDGEYATCRLTKGNFTIDFNGHTVQNANNSLTVFVVSGANVTLKDSKVKKNTPSVRSYGAGAVQITSGSLTINSGNYFGLSNGTNNPSGLHVGGGTCTVNGGGFYGDYTGASCAGGTLRINNNAAFQGGYTYGLMQFGGGKISITKARFQSGVTTYGYQFAIGAYCPNGQTFDFNNWLASGSSFDTAFQTGYWNMQASVTAYPTMANYWAVAYNTPTLSITSSLKAPSATSIKSVKASSKALKIKWKKRSSNNSGYQIQYSASKKFKSAKTVTVKGASKGSKKLTKLKSKKKYYVRVRCYRSFNGTTLHSAWSKAKSKKTK